MKAWQFWLAAGVVVVLEMAFWLTLMYRGAHS